MSFQEIWNVSKRCFNERETYEKTRTHTLLRITESAFTTLVCSDTRRESREKHTDTYDDIQVHVGLTMAWKAKSKTESEYFGARTKLK